MDLKKNFLNSNSILDGGFNTMTKDKLIAITERNLKKAQIAFENNCNRTGVTEQEVENLKAKVEYNQTILNLINAKKSTYQQAKSRARDKAIEWQMDIENHNYSYGELAYYQEYFERIGRRYGLISEFRENGII
jgi:hypothetical protein